MSELRRGRIEFTDPTQASYREKPGRPIGLYKPPPPLLRTPDGIPEGWYVTVDNGVPVLWKWKPCDAVTRTPERYRNG